MEFIVNAAVEALDALTEYTQEDADTDAQDRAVNRIESLVETVKNAPHLH